MVGAWHLGSVMGACLAEAGSTVHLWDQNDAVAQAWEAGKPPVFEPGLEALAQRHWQTGLFWTPPQRLVEVARQATWIVLAYDTPVDDGDNVVLDDVEVGFRQVIRGGVDDRANFLLTAQLPVGTSARLEAEVLQHNPRWRGRLCYMPENLRLGRAIESFQHPDRIVVGSRWRGQDAVELADQLCRLLGLEAPRINSMGLESAEMVKHALNAFLGTCIVFANSIADISEQVGADAWEVLASLKQDARVGPKAFLSPGLGFAGATIGRDVRSLSRIEAAEVPPTPNLFAHVYDLNASRNAWIVASLTAELGTLTGKRIALLGITYKPSTSTVRRSPAIAIGTLLVAAGAHCTAMDPMADLAELSPAARRTLPFEPVPCALEALRQADAAVVVTEWPEFRAFAWHTLTSATPSVVVDAKNLLHGVAWPDGVRRVVPGKPSPRLR